MVVVAGLVACSQPPPSTDHLVLGAAMPDVVLTDLDGGITSLAEYHGKLVVLNLWATWCEPCRREMPNLQQLSDTLDPNRFVVIGLSVDDDLHLVREYLLDKGVTFPAYIDKTQQTSRDLLGIGIFPYTLLIAPDGTLIQRFVGPREWHRDEVVKIIQQAFSGDYSKLQ